jgi:hypothetical protein
MDPCTWMETNLRGEWQLGTAWHLEGDGSAAPSERLPICLGLAGRCKNWTFHLSAEASDCPARTSAPGPVPLSSLGFLRRRTGGPWVITGTGDWLRKAAAESPVMGTPTLVPGAQPLSGTQWS